jgi:hypothetical protein
MELVAGRDQGQFAAEIPRRRCRQTINQRLAVVARSALAHDQQMVRAWFILELIASDDLDHFGADAAPGGDPTAHNIGRRDLNRSRGIA